MELLPCDCLKIICEFIKDKDFINFISSSKYFRSLIKYNLKIMTEQYKISKIADVKNVYVFVNILYDLANFYVIRIPDTITEITFCDGFDGKLDELCNFKHLTKINIGMYYWNKISYDILPNIINKKEIAMTRITNNVFAKLFNFDTTQYYVKFDNLFLDSFKQVYNMNYDRYKKEQTEIGTIIDTWDLDFNIVQLINKSINKPNNYEFCYYKKTINDMENDFDNYMELWKFHINKIMDYLIKLKNIICDKHEKIRNEFLEDTNCIKNENIEFGFL